MRFADLAGRRVVVWGGGREGRSVTAHCAALGVDVHLAETDTTADGVALLRSAEVVIKSPGVPVTSELYGELRAAGIQITSLSDLWIHDNADRTIAVTGTKGKSTTAALIDHLLRAAGVDSVLLGNIGRPVLDEPRRHDWAVVEMSSYQCQSLTVSPRVAVVTSLFPEHVPWHGSVAAYYRDKLNLVRHGPQWVVCGAAVEDAVSAQLGRDVDAVAGPDDAPSVTELGGPLPLVGRHNAGNIAVALATVGLVAPHVSRESWLAGVASFAPLEHRMQPIASTDGRLWLDDSLATAPEAVIAALEALPGRAVAVVVGGADRGLDFSVLVAWLREHPEVVPVLIGPAGARVAESAPDLVVPGRGRWCARFADAMDSVRSPDNPAEVVLLSPGAPSFDEFTDYVERARAFAEAAGR